MHTPFSPHPRFRTESFVLFSCAIAVAVGGLVLFGWTFDVSALKSVLADRVAMNPATAICFILASASLYLLRAPGARPWQRRCASLAALTVAVVGATKVAGYLLGWDPGIDRLFFRARLGTNEIAPNTAFNFLLMGSALFCFDHKMRGGRRPSEALAIIVAIGSVLSLVGYAFGARVLYGVASSIPMALNTAGVFHILSLGLLAARPDRGMTGLVLGNSVGGTLARRLVPAAIAIPALLGWLRMAGQSRGLYDSELGVALMVAVTILSLLLLILWTAEILNRTDARRQRAEASLRESEARFGLLVDSVQDYAIFMLDPNGHVATWNAGARRIKGYTAEEIIGQHFSRFFPDGVVRGMLDRELRLAAANGRYEEDAWRQRKDGTRFWANVIITPVRNAAGQLTGFAKVTRDITERLAAEEAIRQLTQGLEQRVVERTAELAESNRHLTQQNEENEMFVYSVSHDLRSPLVNLQGFSKELEAACNEVRDLLTGDHIPEDIRRRATACLDEGMKEPIRFIQTAVTRLGAIIDALLRLSRAGRVEYHSGRVDVNAVVARVVDSMSGTIAARRARVTVEDLHPAWADATAVEQVFANLVGNALNYLEPTRSAEIAVGMVGPSETDTDEGPAMATFFIRDNGCGVPPAHQGKVFQAFQRLRPEMAQGEGMGLPIVRRIVERHGGRIWLESTANVGSTFFVTLPAAEREHDGATNNAHVREREDLLCLTNR
jgi:PAS domain S-box-containing protein